MPEIPLTPRLKMVLGLIPDAESCWDIGTDHGYLAAALALRGMRVTAADVNPGPLGQARKNLIRFGLEDRVRLRLSDGLAAMEDGEADCVVIAGMGGELIAGILSKGTKNVRHFVLQPQSTYYELRDWLSGNGFRILRETVCREGQRYYTAMLTEKGPAPPLTEEEKHIGPVLLRDRPPLLGEYLASRRRETEKILEKIGGAETPRREECAALIEMYKKYEGEDG